MGDPYFDAFFSSTVEFLNSSAAYQQKTVQAAGASLLDRIGKPVVLIGHSQGGIMPWLIADIRPHLVHSIINIEPTGPPFQDAVFTRNPARPYGLTDTPLTYDPPITTNPANELVKQTLWSTTPAVSNCTIQADSPSPRKLVNLKDIPVVVVTAPASFHAVYDWCTVRYLVQAGVNATHFKLEDAGVHGNGHMIFLEENSDEVAELLMRVIDRT